MLVVFALWLTVNGRITPETIIFGAALALLCGVFAHTALDYTPRWELRMLRAIPIALAYIALLIWEIAKAALSVLRIALNPHSLRRATLRRLAAGRSHAPRMPLS